MDSVSGLENELVVWIRMGYQRSPLEGKGYKELRLLRRRSPLWTPRMPLLSKPLLYRDPRFRPERFLASDKKTKDEVGENLPNVLVEKGGNDMNERQDCSTMLKYCLE